MLQKTMYAFTMCTLFLYMTSSCGKENKTSKVQSKNEHSQESNVTNIMFDREPELFEVLDSYNVPTSASTIVLMPPTKCASCKLGALAVLDSLEHIYILSSDSSFYDPQFPTQKIIVYDTELISRKGLAKLYPAIITIRNRQVVKYEALMN